MVQRLPDDAPPATASADQLKALDEAMTALGLADRQSKLAHLTQLLGREVTSARDLTVDEVRAALAAS
jgi:hypothetical protein